MMNRTKFIESLRPALQACHEWIEQHGKECACIDCVAVQALQYMLNHVEDGFANQTYPKPQRWEPVAS